MPQHEIKIGARFQLGPWEWEVVRIGEGFGFKSVKAGDDFSELWLDFSDADSLDWIAPKVTISKEAVEEIMRLVGTDKEPERGTKVWAERFESQLRSMIE